MRSRLLISTALVLSASALIAPAASAQDPASAAAAADESSAGETVTVTAQKREEKLQDVPISIKVLSGEELAQINADGLEDITRLVPSLTMTNLSRGGNQVQIRGLGSNVGSVGTVAIYNDGVIASSRIQSSGTFAEQDSVLYDTRVEVLRGPQGTLYGEGSFGGVINIISNEPEMNVFGASLSSTVADVEEASDNDFDVQGMVNVPVADDMLAVRFVAYNYDKAGYIDAVNILPLFFGAPPELVAEDANTQEVSGGRVIVAFNPTAEFDAKFTYKIERTELGINSTVSPSLIELANGLGGTDFNTELSQALFSSAIGSQSDVDEAILELNYDTGFGTLTSVTGYGTSESENANTAMFDAKAWSEELRLASDNDGTFNWIVGFYYRDAERDITYIGLPFARDELTQWAVFGEAYWEFAPSWRLTAGLRYEEQESRVTDQLNALPTVEGNFDSIVPKIAVDWKVEENTLLYASVAKGFRAGGANVDTSLGFDPTYEASFDPDEIWSYELGVKSTFLDDIVTVNAALFYIDWTDIQIDKAINSIVTPPLQFITVNGDDAHSFGIEADIYINPGDGWEIVLGGSWVEAEFDGGIIFDNPGVPVSIDGMRLASSPEYLFNASVEKRFGLTDGIDGYVRADFSLRGSSYGDVPNTPPPGGDFSSGQSSNVNLRAGVQGETWEIQAFATNLFDERDSTFTFSDPANFADVNVVLPPRTIGLTLKLRFETEDY